MTGPTISISINPAVHFDAEPGEWTAYDDELRVAAAGLTEEEARANFAAALSEIQPLLLPRVSRERTTRSARRELVPA